MQDAELFFQAADHRHLFLYLDGLAEAHADDCEALQKKIKRLEQELQQSIPASQLWRIPILRKRIIHDALACGIFFPPAPEIVPDALQRLLANDNIFAGIDAAVLSREQGLRIPVLRESLCLLYIALEKFPDLTWETVLNILSGAEVFESIELSRLAPSNFRIEKTPLYLVTYNGIWIHQHADWKKLTTRPQELGNILSQKTIIRGTSEEVCIALNARLASSNLPRP